MKRIIIRIIKVLAWAVLAISILLFSLLYYIGIHATPEEPTGEGVEPDSLCNTPQCVIYLLPYENFTSEEANKLKPVLQEKFGSFLYGHWEFKLLPSKKLPTSTYIKDINKYRATAILDYEKSLIKGCEMIIGLTHKDICMDIHGKNNYGIIGCSFKPSQA